MFTHSLFINIVTPKFKRQACKTIAESLQSLLFWLSERTGWAISANAFFTPNINWETSWAAWALITHPFRAGNATGEFTSHFIVNWLNVHMFKYMWLAFPSNISFPNPTENMANLEFECRIFQKTRSLIISLSKSLDHPNTALSSCGQWGQRIQASRMWPTTLSPYMLLY